jgi:aspartyl-tRNA(Asn)/glutamyl-tRNA(Gln) amidotransferase subunit B
MLPVESFLFYQLQQRSAYLCNLSQTNQYETVIGLEVHIQLSTKSKLFSGESTEFGASPNTQLSAITLAHPGTLPRLNRKAVEFGVRLGLAIGSEISATNYFSRKNYFYPDLPKGYQVTQHSTPICTGGKVEIDLDNQVRYIQLHHIHLEEDAGKSIHGDHFTSIDLNRAGTALLEMVTEPVLRTGEEAYQFLLEVRRLVRFLGICDGNMDEGSLRCDANVSVRKKGEQGLGTRVEIKNLNSMRFVRAAINYEGERLAGILASGGKIKQETRAFDDHTGTTFSSREKEEAHDYRYFPEPDLPPFIVGKEMLAKIKNEMPRLPRERKTDYIAGLGLSVYDAGNLVEEKEISEYFEEMVKAGAGSKAAANWILGPIRSWLNANNMDIAEFPITPGRLAKAVKMVEDGQLSFSNASTRLFREMITDPAADPRELAVAKDLVKLSDAGSLEAVIDEVLQNFASKVLEYRKGKKGLLSLFVGEVMKRTRGQADPKLTNEILLEKLNEK